MDRKTLLAVILSTVVLAVGFYLQNVLFPPAEIPVEQVAAPDASEVSDATVTGDAADPADGAAETTDGGSEELADGEYDFAGRQFAAVESEDGEPSRRIVSYEDPGFLRVEMSTEGANIVSVQLLSHLDGGEPLEFFFGGSEKYGLTMSLGGIDGELLDPVFYYRRGSAENVYEFYRTIVLRGHEDQPFELVKRYTFMPGEYMFELDVELRNSVNDFVPMNFGGDAYTLSIGPQIGPEFVELPRNSRTDFRKFSYLDGNKRRDIRNISDGERRSLEEISPWAAVNGKYFLALAIPGNSGSQIVFGAEPTDEGIQGSQLHLVRPRLESSRVSDSYRFFFGPKSAPVLRQYDVAEDNGFGIRELQLDALIESSWLGWLESALKWIMDMFYRLIPNWGVSIILLTILVKLLLYPLTRKSYESTAKQKEIAPKVAALKEKFGDDAQKLNAATMELYKKEGVNPLGGCLPILLQFPFFIAMFSLFNNHFDLRGAVFIPGWITDLSSPEAILNFPFTIPLVSWDALRLLPILFLATQLISTKFTQPADPSQNNTQMKMMTLGMPIMFFFIMYNMPSGLLVYWIFQNVITTGQQILYNYFTHKKNTQAAK
jgi:YidC/Oxa1 family membrane protein insertase